MGYLRWIIKKNKEAIIISILILSMLAISNIVDIIVNGNRGFVFYYVVDNVILGIFTIGFIFIEFTYRFIERSYRRYKKETNRTKTDSGNEK